MSIVKVKMMLLSRLRLSSSWLVLTLTLLILLSMVIPLRLAITLAQTPNPQAILVLDGEAARIMLATEFSRSHPTLEIWLSGCCSNSVLNSSFFQQAGIPSGRVHYDLRPTDTVTHFTSIVRDFATQDIRHVYMITSDYQMRRARAIATLVFGSRGIAVTPVSVPSNGSYRESRIRTLRDGIRSLVWIITGQTGASLKTRRSACRYCNSN
ncbi:MAG TPA: YdcF family protein [Candidatus Obscuribacterales bacterium]